MCYLNLVVALLLLNGHIADFTVNMPVHAVHISTFEMAQQAADSSGKIQLRVFQDDFRDAIKNANLDLSAVSNDAFLIARKTQIEQYFQQYLRLDFDGQNSPISLINSQVEGTVYWFYFDYFPPLKWQKCTLQADYLMELFDDQSNIATLFLEGERQFFRFTKEEKEVEIIR